MSQGSRQVIRFGVFQVDLHSGEVFRNGIKVKIQDQPFKILEMLLEHPGEIILRDEIRKRIWSEGTFVDFDLGLNTAVRKLRQALGDDADAPVYIETVPRRGYRFLAPVSRESESENADKDQALRSREAQQESSTKPHRTAESFRHARWPWVLAGSVVCVVLLVVAAYLGWLPPQRQSLNSLVILPFANETGDPNAEYLSDGITEDINNRLSRLPELRVVPRSTAFRYKGSSVDAQDIGNQLNVRAVLTGRVSQRGDTLSIGAELVDVSSRSQIWGQTYTAKTADLLTTQDQISTDVFEQLRMRLTRSEMGVLNRRYTDNVEAYHLYLEGRYYWNKRSKESVLRSVDDYKEALKKDPNFALAYSGLADSYLILAEFTYLPPKDSYPQAREWAKKAIAIDDSLAEAHTSLASIFENYDWDWKAADVEYRRAIELNPNYSVARTWYAQALVRRGETDEALRQIVLARNIDPLSLSLETIAGRILYFGKRYPEALTRLHKAVDLDPSFSAAHLALGQTYEQMGKLDEALDEFHKAEAIEPQSSLIAAGLGHCLATAGRRTEAQAIAKRLEKQSKEGYVSPGNLAIVYAGLNDKERAIKYLTQASDERSNWITFLGVEPRFDNLRADSRFKDFVARSGLHR